MTKDRPDFSPLATGYARSRPGYPSELYEWLASLAPSRGVAWDAATGNGQAALGLAKVFERVVASDVSETQLLHAKAHPRVSYFLGEAEEAPLLESSVDLVVAAAAAHWFDLARFGGEVQRVTKPGGLLAVWTYHVAHMEGTPANLITRFYEDVVAPYFGAGARLVDDQYRTLTLPGEIIPAPRFWVSAEWNLAQFLDFVRSWSGVQSFVDKEGRDPVVDLGVALSDAWGARDRRVGLRWPIYARVTRMI